MTTCLLSWDIWKTSRGLRHPENWENEGKYEGEGIEKGRKGEVTPPFPSPQTHTNTHTPPQSAPGFRKAAISIPAV